MANTVTLSWLVRHLFGLAAVGHRVALLGTFFESKFRRLGRSTAKRCFCPSRTCKNFYQSRFPLTSQRSDLVYSKGNFMHVDMFLAVTALNCRGELTALLARATAVQKHLPFHSKPSYRSLMGERATNSWAAFKASQPDRVGALGSLSVVAMADRFRKATQHHICRWRSDVFVGFIGAHKHPDFQLFVPRGRGQKNRGLRTVCKPHKEATAVEIEG